MGQTLSHGVYLPNEGERNCYTGLASNWQILNTAVGAIAEKAPLVHTHTKSDITDFPAYGNTAGTICEGNDSRLSDARTPVAHTHTKGDVTDLLNSNFIPSANNSYDLGSSSYQWNNLYAKNYYYNGTPWGLDKANEWTEKNTFSDYSFTGSGYGFVGQGNRISYILPEFAAGYSGLSIVTPAFNKSVKIGVWTTDANTGKIILNQSGAYLNISAGILDDVNTITITPRNAISSNIGDSNNKWTTLNGVNPGALGLPSGNYDPIDTNGWDLTGATSQSYMPTVNGWLYISIQNIAGNYLSISAGRGAIAMDGTGAQAGLRAILPVIANESVGITVKTGAIFAARFYPMQGNVS